MTIFIPNMPHEKISESYTPGEEKANAITHGFGSILSLIGCIFLILKARSAPDGWYMVSYTLFGISLVLLYTSSFLYHSLPGPETKKTLRKIDHSAIYVLIAGTYTPFLLTNLRGTTGWIMFGIVWVFAIIGIRLKFKTQIGSKWLSASIYLVMGWLAVFIYRSMIDNLSGISLVLLAAGGFFYTSGVIFYVWKNLKFHHAIWHFFVLAGSICHYFSIYYNIQY